MAFHGNSKTVRLQEPHCESEVWRIPANSRRPIPIRSYHPGPRPMEPAKYVFRQHQKWAPPPTFVQPNEPGNKVMRRSVSFLERDPAQPQRLVYECWPDKIAPNAKNSSSSGESTKKISRSKSFLDSNGGGVRKMLKKSASILYPSWLAANKKGNLMARQSSNKDEETKVEELVTSVAPSAATAAVGASAATATDDGWEPVNTSTGNKHAVVVPAAAAETAGTITATGRQVQQLPRLSERNRLVKSPTTVDHPAVVSNKASSVLSSHSSSTTSSSHHIKIPSNKKWSARNIKVNRKPSSSSSSAVSKERRWQSLITLPDHPPSNGSETGTTGSVRGSEPARPTAATSFLELGDDFHHYQAVKAHSQTSLVFIQQSKHQSVLFDSGPSYESLDDYLLTSDEELRRNHLLRKTLPYCDSFESLPRPPPPADADYSPPDVSPDSSENRTGGNDGGGGRIRQKLQRLPTFIQRQEAWQRKNHYAKRLSIPEATRAAPSSSSPEPWLNGWRSRDDDEDGADDYHSGIQRQPQIPMTTNHPAVYWHDWLPPPADLLDCGCGLCRLTAAMNSRPPPRLPPLPPRFHHQQLQQLPPSFAVRNNKVFMYTERGSYKTTRRAPFLSRQGAARFV